MNIFQRDSIRRKLLTETYNYTKADTRQPIDFRVLGQSLEIENAEIEKAYYYLKDENLIESFGMGLTITISHFGIKTVESYLRRIDFNEDEKFTSTEVFQLRIMLDEIKKELLKVSYGQQIIFDEIEKSFEKSKVENKLDWKKSMLKQIKDWTTNKVIDKSSSLIFQSILAGLKLVNE